MRKTTFPAVLSTFFVSYCFWILLTWSWATEELIAGAVVSLAVALFSARFFIHNKAFWFFNPAKFFIFLLYWVIFFPVELIKANWDMAKRCYDGCRKVNPGIVRVPVEIKGDYGQAQLANSITLTPGTMTLDICEDQGRDYYYVHWIDVAETDRDKAGDIIKGTMEKWLRRIWE